jgi:hypothetical protein
MENRKYVASRETRKKREEGILEKWMNGKVVGMILLPLRISSIERLLKLCKERTRRSNTFRDF